MDINKIKFVPKANAFAEVYGKATGVPFIGELVAAAAGNGGEPTPPTPSVVESVTVYGIQEGAAWTINGTVTFNQDFVTENCDAVLPPELTLDIKDSNNTIICDALWNVFYDCETNNVFESSNSDIGTLPTIPESGNYSILVTKGSETIYEGTGTWTYQDPQI